MRNVKANIAFTAKTVLSVSFLKRYLLLSGLLKSCFMQFSKENLTKSHGEGEKIYSEKNEKTKLMEMHNISVIKIRIGQHVPFFKLLVWL